MTIAKLHFPHISRIFSALCLWALLLALIGINGFFRISTHLAYSDKLTNVLINPFSANAHDALAQTLGRVSATRERGIVSELSPVLGASTTAKEQQRQTETRYWQNVLAKHPDYRDGYIKLAALAYYNGNLALTHTYLAQAQTLDPNNVTVNSLLNFTSKLLE